MSAIALHVRLGEEPVGVRQLLARRNGTAPPRGQRQPAVQDRSIPNWLCADRGEHSAKPEQVRALVERVSPPPYLELFGRKPVHGWAVFGNQISRGLFDDDIERLD